MVGDFLQQKREKKKFDYERFDRFSVPIPFHSFGRGFLNQNHVIFRGFPRVARFTRGVSFHTSGPIGLTKCMSQNHKIGIPRGLNSLTIRLYTRYSSDHEITIPHGLKSCTRPVLRIRIQ
jgi:hypothetical protein